MPNSPFSTDFGFRRGTEEKFNRTAIQDGSINLCVDTGNLYIDIDGQRISTRDITIKETEAEIYALPAPNPRMYFAKDTYNLLYFDTKLLIWRIVGSEHVRYSDLAIGDSEGHRITEWYETISNSDSKIAGVNADIEYLRYMISQISSFEIVVLDSADDLPEEGQSHTIYFVPQEDSDEDTQFDEYIWLDEGYYEKIGITKPDLTDYYKKTETDDLLDSLKSELEGEIGDVNDTVSGINDDLQSTKGHLSSTIEAVTDLEGVVSGNNTGSIERDEALGSSITELGGIVNNIIGDDSISLDDINLKALADKDAAIVGDDTLDLSTTNLASLQNSEDDHETRIAALESGGGGGGVTPEEVTERVQEATNAIKGDEELDLDETNLKSLQDGEDNHETRIAALEAGGGGGGGVTPEVIERIQEAIDAVKGDEDLDTDVTNLYTLQTSVDRIKGSDDVDTDLINLKTLYEDIEAMLGSEELDPENTNLTSLQTSVDRIIGDSELDLDETNLKSIKDDIDTLQTSSSDLTTRMGTAEGNIANLQTNTSGLSDDLSTLSTDYGNYKTSNNTNIANTKEELHSSIVGVNDSLEAHKTAAAEIDEDLQDQIDLITQELMEIGRFSCVIVESFSELPLEGENGVLYFVPTEDPDIYNEYIWISNEATYHLVGFTTLNLNNYYMKYEVDNLTSGIRNDFGYSKGWISANTNNVIVDFGLE